MKDYQPLRELPETSGYKKGDVLVIFGELFAKGYANGLVEAALKQDMTIIQATVGRRDENNNLRPLNDDELKEKSGPVINIPLEAGFDFEPDNSGQTPCDQLAGIKMKEWQQAQLDWNSIEQSKANAIARFKKNTTAFLAEVEKQIPDGANVIFAHTMAGGIPRAKIFMPILNRIVKGRGDRFQPSEPFWNSELGKLCSMNFDEVTADTFQHLVELSQALREKIQSNGGKASYVAYGYHGTEVLINNEYRWQSYSPYIQGWAKMRLENHAKKFMQEGIHCTVYNCPEILTNSSAIFLGVEVCLYPLMKAYRKEFADKDKAEKHIAKTQGLLNDDSSIEGMLERCESTLSSPIIKESYDFPTWPQHNTQEQMGTLLEASTDLINMHKDTKDLITFRLSEDVFKATGSLMLDDTWNASQPVWWLNHDIVAKKMDQLLDS